MANIRTCRHLHSNGKFCGSPALRHNFLCYFHFRLAQREQRRVRLGGPLDAAGHTGIELPLLEDAESIQIAINEVTRAIIDQRIDRHRAGLLLYSFQLALQNVRNLKPLTTEESDAYALDVKDSQWEGTLEDPVDPEEEPFSVRPDSVPPVANDRNPEYCNGKCRKCDRPKCSYRECKVECQKCANKFCADRKAPREERAPKQPATIPCVQASAARYRDTSHSSPVST